MASAPAFAATGRLAVVQVTTANTARDGSGTPVTVFTAGASGSLLEKVRVCSTGTVTAGVVRLFVHDGTNARLLKELMVTATTPSTSVEAFSVEYTPPGGALFLPSGYSLRATTHNTETFNVFAQGADV
jgi:hypothetical protein